MIWASAFLWLAAVVLALGARRPRSDRRPRPDALPAWIRVTGRAPLPRAWVTLVHRLREPAHTRRVLVRCGTRADPDDIDRVACSRVVSGAIGALASVAAGARPPVAAVAIATVVVAATPDVLLARRARVRLRAIERSVPEFLDLVALSAGAGMALDSALGLVVRRLPGPLSREVATTLDALALGTPRVEAIRALAERCPLPAIERLSGALVQAVRFGMPLRQTLAEQAAGLREDAVRAARERADRATPKIQLIVALVIVPGAMVLILGVLVLQLANEIGAVVA